MCPVARASEIFAERWRRLILREILAGRQHFNQIQQGLHRISPSVLGARLRALEQAGIIKRGPNPSGRGHTYQLTQCGADLGELVEAPGVWGQRWLELRREHLNTEFLMWRLYTQLQVDQLPRRRMVFRFRFRDEPRAYWLVVRAFLHWIGLSQFAAYPPPKKYRPGEEHPDLGKRPRRTLESALRLAGRVISPRDPEYDRARRIWKGAIDRRPLPMPPA